MKIGFDISQTGASKAGTGFQAFTLIQSLAEIDSSNEYVLYPTFGEYTWDENWRSSLVKVNAPNFTLGLGHPTLADMRAFWHTPPADFENQLDLPDIIHANNFYCPKGLRRARLVYTFYDLGFLEEPNWTTESNRTICFEGVFNASLYADMIISISEASSQAFLRFFPHFPAERILTIPLASRFKLQPVSTPQILLNTRILPDQFWLINSTLEPRKNFNRLAQAYARLKAATVENFPLVLTGGKGWLMENFSLELKKLGIYDDVILLGYVDDAVLQWLYQNCFAFVFPTLYEGFGLPALEAMSLGAAVISSNTTSMPEVVGEAGILVDPYSVEGIAEAMLSLFDGRVDRSLLRQKALEQASKFSWLNTARMTLSAYETVLDRPPYRAPQLAASDR